MALLLWLSCKSVYYYKQMCSHPKSAKWSMKNYISKSKSGRHDFTWTLADTCISLLSLKIVNVSFFRSARMARICQWFGRCICQHHRHFSLEQDNVQTTGSWFYHMRGSSAIEKGRNHSSLQGNLTAINAKIYQFVHHVWHLFFLHKISQGHYGI